jgi:dTDP-4-amino-4,6-dideoxygalactose transaminase
MDHAADGPWYYQQVLLGYNYRMTELQAALGVNQLRSIENFIAKRHEVRARYDKELAALPLVLPPADEDGRSALHLYPVQLQVGQEHRRAAVFDGLRRRGIGVNVHYIPIHTQPYYRALGFEPGDFPAAESYYARAMSLPMHAGLTGDEIGQVIAALRAELG